MIQAVGDNLQGLSWGSLEEVCGDEDVEDKETVLSLDEEEEEDRLGKGENYDHWLIGVESGLRFRLE